MNRIWRTEKELRTISNTEPLEIGNNYYVDQLGSDILIKRFKSLNDTKWMILDMLYPIVIDNIKRTFMRSLFRRDFFTCIMVDLEHYHNSKPESDYKIFVNEYHPWFLDIDIYKEAKFDNNMKLVNQKEIRRILEEDIFDDFDECMEELLEWNLVTYKKSFMNKFFPSLRYYSLTEEGINFIQTKTSAVDYYPKFMGLWLRL